MILSQISDGLGNQLFQYATGFAFAQKHGVPFKLEKHWFTHEINTSFRQYSLDYFNIQAEDASYAEIDAFIDKDTFFHRLVTPYYKRIRVFEGANKFDPKFLKIKPNTYLLGYWQSWRYFHDCKNLLLKEFQITLPVDDHSKKYLEEIQNGNSVGVHIRRGDYVTNPTFNTLSMDYYRSAVDYLNKKLPDLKWFVFSDDQEWAKQNLDFIDKPVFVEGLSTIEDFRLLNKCRHNIVANSTFSWWAGYLKADANAIVIGPQKPFATNMLYAPEDYYPPEFILM